jgi:hypothetical protein
MTVQDFDCASAVPASLESEILLRGAVLYGRKEAKASSELAQEGVA